MLRNYLVGIVQEAVEGLDLIKDARNRAMNRARTYRQGSQPKPIRTKEGQTDDNIIVNFVGLIVDRATALLFGEGVEFDLPGEGETEQEKYIKNVWKANKKSELLSDVSDYGATFGTPVFQIRPNAVQMDGELYPEVSCIDPRFFTIVPEPENYRSVKMYVIEYTFTDGGVTKTRRREIIPVKAVDPDTGTETVVSWKIDSYVTKENGRLEFENTEEWDFDFPHVLPFKNLPEAGTPYGRPDVTEDVLHIQDAINRVMSSTNKAIRLTAFQRLWGKFLKNNDKVSMGMDNILSVDNKDAELNAIDAGSNFEGMIAFQQELRDALFTISRSSDPSAAKDKVGQLTNFGLRILYKDALDKLKTKRELYGEALRELNRRLLILNDMEGDPGEVQWKEPLPQNESELIAGYKFDIEQGLASKETISEKRGYDSEQEQERIQAEMETSNQNNENIGAGILQNFNRGVPQNVSNNGRPANTRKPTTR